MGGEGPARRGHAECARVRLAAHGLATVGLRCARNRVVAIQNAEPVRAPGRVVEVAETVVEVVEGSLY